MQPTGLPPRIHMTQSRGTKKHRRMISQSLPHRTISVWTHLAGGCGATPAEVGAELPLRPQGCAHVRQKYLDDLPVHSCGRDIPLQHESNSKNCPTGKMLHVSLAGLLQTTIYAGASGRLLPSCFPLGRVSQQDCSKGEDRRSLTALKAWTCLFVHRLRVLPEAVRD